MSQPIIKVKNLYKTIRGNHILNNINFEAHKGEIYGIVGRNGSGKSMFFKTISGLILPSKGNVEIFGEHIGQGRFPKNFGILLDVPGFLPHYSAVKNLKLLASINNLITDEDINNVIHLVGLDPNNNPVKKFSLGMIQRLGIAQAIMEKPQLIILDEPMNGLDEEGVNKMRDLFLKIKESGATILLSSHDSQDIEILCDHVYKMESGRLSSIS